MKRLFTLWLKTWSLLFDVFPEKREKAIEGCSTAARGVRMVPTALFTRLVTPAEIFLRKLSCPQSRVEVFSAAQNY